MPSIQRIVVPPPPRVIGLVFSPQSRPPPPPEQHPVALITNLGAPALDPKEYHEAVDERQSKDHEATDDGQGDDVPFMDDDGNDVYDEVEWGIDKEIDDGFFAAADEAL